VALLKAAEAQFPALHISLGELKKLSRPLMVSARRVKRCCSSASRYEKAMGQLLSLWEQWMLE